VAVRTLINHRYELDELPLALGGMGEVWTGRDIKLERQVAVKFLRFPDGQPDQELTRRFVRESRITARLEHPGVPAIYDVGTHDGRPYLVMQRVHGISVADLNAEQAPLPVDWAAAIAAQTCAVLAAAHAASLVHRDLKPANLMLDRDGGVKVLDFGLAVALDRPEYSHITSTGQILGTAAYMGPEQVMAAMSGPRTDLYALGCTLYEMLSGAQPFTGPTPYAVMSKQVHESPRPLRELRADVPVPLAELVGELLQKRPDDRPASAAEVYQRLLPFVTDLGPLPGVVDRSVESSPVRMYARVLNQVLASGPAGTGVGGPVPAPRSGEPGRTGGGARRPGGGHLDAPLDRDQVGQARERAGSLARQSRYSQAAEVLETVLEPATQVFGGTDDLVISLRREYATVLFEGGDYRRAAPQFRRLADDLAARPGAEEEPVLRFRLQEATCYALVGDTMRALAQLHDLRADYARAFGADDPRTLELRRQIGLLQLGAGAREEAAATLDGLLADAIRVHGPDHPTVTGVRDLLAGLRVSHR